MLFLSGCTSVHSSGIFAQEVPGPSDVRCFVILEDGKAVGGNCVLR